MVLKEEHRELGRKLKERAHLNYTQEICGENFRSHTKDSEPILSDYVLQQVSTF